MRPGPGPGWSKTSRFQSTHSLRSATGNGQIQQYRSGRFNPRTPCGVRRGNSLVAGRQKSFNPRTPCGVRLVAKDVCDALEMFQSTHSLRSATHVFHPGKMIFPVSIHALLAECDAVYHNAALFPPVSIHALLAECDLLSIEDGDQHGVSIHALLAECDTEFLMPLPRYAGFNPRTPCGVRRLSCKNPLNYSRFQSTHSLRSATRPDGSPHPDHVVSIHALLAECDQSGSSPD